MIVIKTEFVELPEYCEACCYFGSRPHPRDGWMDLCELCGERIDGDGCKDDGAFVAYHEGETGAKTPYDLMHKLINSYAIKESSLGGDYFKTE